MRETRTIPAGTTLSLADHCVTLEQDTRVSASVEWWPIIQRSIECQHANHDRWYRVPCFLDRHDWTPGPQAGVESCSRCPATRVAPLEYAPGLGNTMGEPT